MTITLASNRLRVTDGAGKERFDSNDDMFHVLDTLNGSRAIPQYVATRTESSSQNPQYQNYIETNVYTLGSCDSLCTMVRGAMKITFTSGAGSYGLPGFGWFAVGGTYTHVMQASLHSSRDGRIQLMPLRQAALYTFSTSGGVVRLTEQLHITTGGGPSNGSATLIVKPFTITYKLKLGLFT